MPPQQYIVMVKAVHVDHHDDTKCVWCEPARLVVATKQSQMYRSGLSPTQDATHACWQAIWPMTVDIQHALAARF